MTYNVEGHITYTARDAAQDIIDCMSEEYYEEMLNETYGDIDICGYKYSAAEALYRVDPTAYRCGMADYYDTLAYDIECEVEGMRDGETEFIYGCEVVALDDEQ